MGATVLAVWDAPVESLSETDGLAVETADTPATARETVASGDVDVVVVSERLRGDASGLDAVEAIRGSDAALPVIFCTATADGALAAAATRRGATEYYASEDPGASLTERVRAHASETVPATRTGRDPVSESGAASDGAAANGGALERSGSDGWPFDATAGRSPFEAIAENSSDGIVTIDADSRIVYANDGVAEIVGRDRASLVGEPFLEFVPETRRSDHAAALREYLATGEREFDWEYVELSLRHAEGHEVPVAVSLGEFRRERETYVTGIVRDVSGQRDREAALERFRDTLQAVDDGVYALDDEGRFVFANDAMEELTGYTAAELRGEHTAIIKDDATVEKAERTLRELLRGEDSETTFELELQPKDGEPFPCEDHMVMLTDDEGRFTGTAGVIRDITERKERERELREARERVERTLERIDDAFYALDDDWQITYVNSRAEELLGIPAADALGETVWDLDTDTVASAFYPEYHRAMDEQEPVVAEEYHAPEERWFEVRVYPASDGLSVYFRDVTERKRRDQRLTALLETSRALMRARDPREVAEIVASATQETLDQELSLVRLYDEDMDQLVPVAQAGDAPAVTDRPTYAPGEGGPGRAFETGETLSFQADVDADPGDVGAAEDAVYVPLGDYGVLVLVTTDPDGFSDVDVSTAEVLASTATVALERADREDELTRYRTVIENVQDMVYVVDESERFSLVTEPFADWLGYDREELIGCHPSEILPDDEVAAFESIIGDLWQSGDVDASRLLETQVVDGDGKHRPAEVEVSLYPTEDSFAGTVGVVRDLTELVRTRELLEEERDRFSYLFDSLPDAVVEATLDEAGQPVVRDVNDAFAEVFGYAADRVRGESLNDFVLPDDAVEEGREIDRRAAEGETINHEVRRKTADGFRDFLFRGIPFSTTDDGTHSFGIYTDITAQKERERRLEVLNRVLRHNLRNDINVILGYAEMLSEELDDDLAPRAEALHEKATELAALSDQARALDETMRRGSPRDSTVAVRPLVEDVVAEYNCEFDALSVEVAVGEVRVVGDNRLRLALEELLENVVEHAGADTTVRVETERDGREVELRVADDGPGVPANELAVITESTEITQLRHGSGLGLWVVKWVCESCGGQLRFEDGRLGGTTVTLSLPSAED